MVTVLEAVPLKIHVLLWDFGGKRTAKDIHKEMFPAYGGKGLSTKAVHKWVEKGGKHFTDGEEVETEMWKCETQSKDSCAAGFDAPVKRWDKGIGVDGQCAKK
jgi:hypothetical protein